MNDFALPATRYALSGDCSIAYQVMGDAPIDLVMHAAARVMAQAQANEVLVSRVVTDLVAGAGLKFAERGSHDLKGIPGKWDLFAAQA